MIGGWNSVEKSGQVTAKKKCVVSVCEISHKSISTISNSWEAIITYSLWRQTRPVWTSFLRDESGSANFYITERSITVDDNKQHTSLTSSRLTSNDLAFTCFFVVEIQLAFKDIWKWSRISFRSLKKKCSQSWSIISKFLNWQWTWPYLKSSWFLQSLLYRNSTFLSKWRALILPKWRNSWIHSFFFSRLATVNG